LEVAEMQDADLFLELAGIAGVFVGFGALIAVRNGAAKDPFEIAPVRGVVLAGMATIIAALAPVVLSHYDIAEHQVWAASSALVLVGYVGMVFFHRRAPEYKAVEASVSERSGRWVGVTNAAESVAFAVVVVGPLLALAAIAAGLVPDIEAAIYLTVVALFLVQAGWTLLWLVFGERRPVAG
jgi:hypothetical protein